MKNKLVIFVLGIFFVFAGVNHFVSPDFYYPLIPDYLPFPSFINIASGILEIVFGLGLFFPPFRKISALGILGLLVLFIPSHIYFIQIGSCITDGLCTAPWIGWLRLLLIHPILIYWAYRAYKIK